MKKLISWVEIPALNMEKAVDFYNQVFDLQLEILDFGEEQMACFPGDEGAISKAPGFKPSSDGVLVSFQVEGDLNRSLDKVKEMGGEIVKGKTKLFKQKAI